MLAALPLRPFVTLALMRLPRLRLRIYQTFRSSDVSSARVSNRPFSIPKPERHISAAWRVFRSWATILAKPKPRSETLLSIGPVYYPRPDLMEGPELFERIEPVKERSYLERVFESRPSISHKPSPTDANVIRHNSKAAKIISINRHSPLTDCVLCREVHQMRCCGHFLGRHRPQFFPDRRGRFPRS